MKEMTGRDTARGGQCLARAKPLSYQQEVLFVASGPCESFWPYRTGEEGCLAVRALEDVVLLHDCMESTLFSDGRCYREQTHEEPRELCEILRAWLIPGCIAVKPYIRQGRKETEKLKWKLSYAFKTP
ncbi:unnamed protein product [Eretmochelys imbricata]